MNKKGQVGIWAYALMLGITVIIIALALAPSLQDVGSEVMNNTVGDTLGLDCNNDTISNFQKGTCVITDFSMFYFFSGLVLIGGSIIIAKIVL